MYTNGMLQAPHETLKAVFGPLLKSLTALLA